MSSNNILFQIISVYNFNELSTFVNVTYNAIYQLLYEITNLDLNGLPAKMKLPTNSSHMPIFIRSILNCELYFKLLIFLSNYQLYMLYGIQLIFCETMKI